MRETAGREANRVCNSPCRIQPLQPRGVLGFDLSRRALHARVAWGGALPVGESQRRFARSQKAASTVGLSRSVRLASKWLHVDRVLSQHVPPLPGRAAVLIVESV